MTTEQGNQELRDLFADLSAQLSSLASQLKREDAYHVQYADFCVRARQFVGYIDVAVALSDSDYVAQAFSLLRSSVEHWAVDAIMLRGDRFVRLYYGSSDEQLLWRTLE